MCPTKTLLEKSIALQMYFFCNVLTYYLEYDEVLVAGPDHVGVHGALLGVARHPGVGALVTNQR